jgi:WD40 repeat protein
VFVVGCKNNTVRVWKHRVAAGDGSAAIELYTGVAADGTGSLGQVMKHGASSAAQYGAQAAYAVASLIGVPAGNGDNTNTGSGALAAAAADEAGTNAHTAPDLVIEGHSSSVNGVAPFDYQDHPYVVTCCKDFDIRVFSLLSGLSVCLLYKYNIVLPSCVTLW